MFFKSFCSCEIIEKITLVKNEIVVRVRVRQGTTPKHQSGFWTDLLNIDSDGNERFCQYQALINSNMCLVFLRET